MLDDQPRTNQFFFADHASSFLSSAQENPFCEEFVERHLVEEKDETEVRKFRKEVSKVKRRGMKR